ncbi:glycosyltransferase [Ideonella sp.]|uniref:glycosyltransferase n=1 Tax=Ideonella sp. TaxID=1929293 RepID=UPI0035AE1A74
MLVFNFFAGLKARGIPVYAAELEECFGRLGIEHRELRAPAWLARAPAALQNVCYVLYEQVVAPLAGRWWRTGLTVYPYNAGSLLDAWSGRAVMVVHDLIPNRRDSGGLAARYIRTCQAWHARLGRPVATVSRHTQRQLRRIERYRRCPLYLWANPFYAFETALQRTAAPPSAVPHAPAAPAQPVRVLLCSGMGANKDYRGALRLLRQLPGDLPVVLRVLGFGDDAALAERALAGLPAERRAQARVLPRLTLDGIVDEFRAADVVWVHSRAEGFGRPVVEARMAGRPVVATDIGAFRPLRRLGHVHLYKDADFVAAFQAALGEARHHQVAAASAQSFNRQLEAEVMRLLRHAGRPDPA